MFQFKRILMNAADQGGASGNPATAAPASAPETVPQAQGDTVSMTKADLETLVSGATKKAIEEVKGSIYAEARRTFTEGKGKKPAEETPRETVAPNLAPQLDPLKMRALDFALTKKGLAPDLTQSQYERAHRDFASDSPADAEAWVADYFHGHAKFATPAVQPAQTQVAPPAKPATEHPASNRGTPPPAQTPIEEIDLWTASESDRAAFIRTKGMKEYNATLMRQGQGRSIKL
jgi:hypothetical protein